MALSISMIPDDMALQDGLYALYQDISSTISFNFDYPSSEDELHTAAANLLTYLIHYTNRNKRRARTALVAKDLHFNVWRTRNLDEETINDNGKRTKGEREWYCLVLSESEGGIGSGGRVQTIGEGELKKDKAALLKGFWEMVKKQNAEWERQDEIIEKEGLEREKRELEISIAKKEIEVMQSKGLKEGEGTIGWEYS